MDTLIGTPVKLSPSTQSFDNVQLSADGTKLVFTADDGATPSAIQVYVADSKLQTITQLTSDASTHVDASISADGTNVVYYNGDNGKIYTIPATGGTATAVLTPSLNDAWGPVFTPDGKKIIFTGYNTSGTDLIYSMNLDGTGLTQLSKGTIWDVLPSVSADGTKITFVREGTNGEDIAVMGIAGETTAAPATILTTTGNNENPIFVGNKIAFISDSSEEFMGELGLG